MKFDRKVLEAGEKKTICISLPSIIVDSYEIKRKDIITLYIYIKTKSIEFTNKVCKTSNMLRITIPKATIIKNNIKPHEIYTFEFVKNHRGDIKK